MSPSPGGDNTPHGYPARCAIGPKMKRASSANLAEAAIAHVVGDRTERAYRRGDALERRRELMDAWWRHREGAAGENLVAFRRRPA